MKQTQLTIVCPGHSGSTLLAMCLDTHSRIEFLGEFETIPRRLRMLDEGKRSGLCSFHHQDCPRFDAAGIERLRRAFPTGFSWRDRLRRLWAHPAYVRDFAASTGAQVVGDSSKGVAWAERLWRFYRWSLDLRFVFLFRDGRGVLSSHLRQGRETDEEARRWRDTIRRIFAFRKRLPAQHYTTIRYEDLATDPAETLTQVCALLDLPFESTMLEYEKHPHHIIGGNAGARAKVRIAQQQQPDRNRKDIAWYAEKNSAFFLDERWKTELNRDTLQRAESIFGAEISALGYAPVTEAAGRTDTAPPHCPEEQNA